MRIYLPKKESFVPQNRKAKLTSSEKVSNVKEKFQSVKNIL